MLGKHSVRKLYPILEVTFKSEAFIMSKLVYHHSKLTTHCKDKGTKRKYT